MPLLLLCRSTHSCMWLHWISYEQILIGFRYSSVEHWLVVNIVDSKFALNHICTSVADILNRLCTAVVALQHHPQEKPLGNQNCTFPAGEVRMLLQSRWRQHQKAIGVQFYFRDSLSASSRWSKCPLVYRREWSWMYWLWWRWLYGVGN